jgi:subtilisin-like proprotein convertase family protein
MKKFPTPTRVALVALAASLALPAISGDAPVVAKRKPRTVTRTFDGLPVELITTGPTSPISSSTQYPTEILIDGRLRKIQDVNVRITNLDHAPLSDETTLQSGSFRPTNATGAAIAFNSPAPTTNVNGALSVFDGTNPNGTWRLFAQDDDAPTGIGFFDSWSLEITAKAKKRRR